MGDNYFLLTNLLSEDERKVITGIAAHIERGEKRVCGETGYLRNAG